MGMQPGGGKCKLAENYVTWWGDGALKLSMRDVERCYSFE